MNTSVTSQPDTRVPDTIQAPIQRRPIDKAEHHRPAVQSHERKEEGG